MIDIHVYYKLNAEDFLLILKTKQIMKPTLKQQLENELHSIKNRCAMIENNIMAYKESNMLLEAATSKIKLDTLVFIADRLEAILSND